MSDILDSFTHIVLTECPFCGKTNQVHLTDDQWKRYQAWKAGKGHIQNVLGDLSSDVREMLISGICPSCWDKTFGME